MIYAIGRNDYRCVYGADVDGQHPHGDLDRIIIDNNLFPFRPANKNESDYKQWQKCLRGEDVAYLLERTCRVNAWPYGGRYDFDGSLTFPYHYPMSAEFSRKIGRGNIYSAVTMMMGDVTGHDYRMRYSSSLAIPDDPDGMMIAGDNPTYMYTAYINPIDSSSIIPTPEIVRYDLDNCAALEKAFAFWNQVNYFSFFGEVTFPDWDTQVQMSETVSMNLSSESVKKEYTPRCGLGVYHRGKDQEVEEEYCYNCNRLIDGLPICSGVTTSHTFGIYVLKINSHNAPGFEQQAGTWTFMVPQSRWNVDISAVTHAVNLATGSYPPTVNDMGIGTGKYFVYTAELKPAAIVAVYDLS